MKPYYENENGKLYYGDCLEIMPLLKPVDLIFTDPPFGTTKNQWDKKINIKRMWECIDNITLENTPILLNTQQPFTSEVVMSNLQMYRQEWIWGKTSATGHLNAKKMPLKAHENLLVFYKKLPIYNPQKTTGHIKKTSTAKRNSNSGCYGKQQTTTRYESTERYPIDIQIFASDKQTSNLNETQKPLSWAIYYTKTYSNPGDVVHDFSSGSGTVAVACEELGRKWILIEQRECQCEIAAKRIEAENRQLKLF